MPNLDVIRFCLWHPAWPVIWNAVDFDVPVLVTGFVSDCDCACAFAAIDFGSVYVCVVSFVNVLVSGYDADFLTFYDFWNVELYCRTYMSFLMGR